MPKAITQWWRERLEPKEWRKRLGEDKLTELIKESPAAAEHTGALRLRDTKRVTVDTTVPPKNIAFPTPESQFLTADDKVSFLNERESLCAKKGSKNPVQSDTL